MRKIQLLIFLLFGFNTSNALNFTIIESLSMGHMMDANWSSVVTGMGHTPTILPQTTLDNTAFFAGTDILIVSSGVIALTPIRIKTIVQFIQSGKPVYLQSEYLASFTTNQAFVEIVDSLGGVFTWSTPFSGDLTPMNVLGTFANTNNIVPSFNYFWYSVSGIGDCNIINFLEYGGAYHGFQYIPGNASYGTIITTTDQDWIQSSSSFPLMENIVTHLITPDALTNLTPDVDLGNDTALCQGQIIALNSDPATSYLWSNGSTGSSITVSAPGVYWLQASNGVCSDRDSINITFISYPNADLGNDTSLCPGQIITLNSDPADSYLWSNGSTDSSINVSGSGMYWVQASNGPCSVSDSLSLFVSNCGVEAEIELPNVFSPNNDGSNENFIPVKYLGIAKANLKIYNRWGKLLFSTEDLLQGWNGHNKEKMCSEGTYYWIVEYTTIAGESEVLKGSLTLVK